MINNRRHIMYVYKPVINTSNNKSVIRMFERDIEISQKKIVHLEIGNPLIRMPATYQAALVWSVLKKPYSRYQFSKGYLPLRRAWVDMYKDLGVDLDLPQVAVTNGGSEVLREIFYLLFNPGDGVIIPQPGYSNTIINMRRRGVEIVPVDTFFDQNFELTIQAIEQVINPKIRGIFLTTPGNNPTGHVIREEVLDFVVTEAVKRKWAIIVDLAYLHLNYSQWSKSIFQYPQIRGQLFALDTLSKSMGLAGERLGLFISFSQEVMTAMEAPLEHRLSAGHHQQIAATVALKHWFSITQKVRREFQKRRNIMAWSLDRASDVIEYVLPEAGLYFTTRLRASAIEMARWLVRDYGGNSIPIISPGIGFYDNPTEEAKYLARLSFAGIKSKDIPHSIDVLINGLREYPY